MDIFSTPEAVTVGPVNLPELLEDSNRTILHLTDRLEEKQRCLDEITALLKNERNRRLTAQNSLEDANLALDELKLSLELTRNKRLLIEHRISRREICSGSDVALKCSEGSRGFHGDQSISLPDESSSVSSSGREIGQCPVSRNGKDLQNELESGQDQEERFSESTARRRHYRNQPELEPNSEIHQMIQGMLERQRQFSKLLGDKSDKIIDELMGSLREFNRLRSSLQMLGEPGGGIINRQSEKDREDSTQQELTKATQGLFDEENRIKRVQIQLASLRMGQIIHEKKIEQEMKVFKDTAFRSDRRKRKDYAGNPMEFSQANYRLKLARLIWDGAAHFSNKDASNGDEDHGDNN